MHPWEDFATRPALGRLDSRQARRESRHEPAIFMRHFAFLVERQRLGRLRENRSARPVWFGFAAHPRPIPPDLPHPSDSSQPAGEVELYGLTNPAIPLGTAAWLTLSIRLGR